jgi:pyruvate/2-oxoglutarate dehydrogenase complex dihydrolipoamide acyltransferase (E2) component
VARGTVGSRLSDAASERAQQLAAVDKALASPRAARVAGRAGVDIDKVRGGLPHLSDSELRDLSQRAAALGSNPAGGYYDDAADMVLLLLVVAVAAAVAIAIANHA